MYNLLFIQVEAADEIMANDVLYVSMGEDYAQPSAATGTSDKPAGSSSVQAALPAPSHPYGPDLGPSWPDLSYIACSPGNW